MDDYKISLLKNKYGALITDYYADILKNYHLYTEDRFDEKGKSIFETALILDYDKLVEFNNIGGDFFTIGFLNESIYTLLMPDNKVLLFNYKKQTIVYTYINVYSYLNQIKLDYKLSFKSRFLNFFKYDNSSLNPIYKFTIEKKFILDFDNQKKILEIYDSKLIVTDYLEKKYILGSELEKKYYHSNSKYIINDNVSYYNGLLYFNNGKVFSNYIQLEFFIKPEEIKYILNVSKNVFIIFCVDGFYCFNHKQETGEKFTLPNNFKILNITQTKLNIFDYLFGQLKYLNPKTNFFISPQYEFLYNNIDLAIDENYEYIDIFNDYYVKQRHKINASDIDFYNKIVSLNKNNPNSVLKQFIDILESKFNEKYMIIYFVLIFKSLVHIFSNKNESIYYTTLIIFSLFFISILFYRLSTKKTYLTNVNFGYLILAFFLVLFLIVLMFINT